MKKIKLDELYNYVTYKQLHLKDKYLKYITCSPVYYCPHREKYIIMINDNKDSVIWASEERKLHLREGNRKINAKINPISCNDPA